jgi:membrane-bound metal-dependent hydrolase YbcI (DUF457 family)
MYKIQKTLDQIKHSIKYYICLQALNILKLNILNYRLISFRIKIYINIKHRGLMHNLFHQSIKILTLLIDNNKKSLSVTKLAK